MGKKYIILSEKFVDKYWIEKKTKGLEIHIRVPFEYESLWLIKLGEMTISYKNACELIGIEQFYKCKNEEIIDMIIEYVDSYWSESSLNNVEFHIQIPENYEKLWRTKLAELTATDEEIEEYRDEVEG